MSQQVTTIAKINDLQDQISTPKASAGDAKSIEELKGDMQKLSDKVDKLSANINVLTFLVNSKLTSRFWNQNTIMKVLKQ